MRLIDADALLKELDEYNKFAVFDCEAVKDLIDTSQTVEITEEQAIDKLHETGWLIEHNKEMTTSPQGKWVFDGCDDVTCKCMFCGHEQVYVTSPKADGVNFCEQCGADMRGGAE